MPKRHWEEYGIIKKIKSSKTIFTFLQAIPHYFSFLWILQQIITNFLA